MSQKAIQIAFEIWNLTNKFGDLPGAQDKKED